MTIIVVVSVLVALFPFFRSVLQRRPDLFSPVFVFACGFTASYGLKGWLMTVDPRLYITYPEKTRDISLALPLAVVSWGALIAFYLGYYLEWPWLAKIFPRFDLSDGALRAARTCSAISVCLAVASMLALVSFVGINAWFNSPEFVDDLRRTVMVAWNDHPMLYHFPVWSPFFGLAAVHAHFCLNPAPGPRRSRFVVAIVLLTTLALAILGSRALLLAFYFSLFLYRHYYIRRVPLPVQATLLLGAALLGGYLGILQKLNSPVGRMAMTLEFPDNIAYRLSSSYEQFESLVNIVRLDPPLEWGSTFFEDIVYTYIPRVLWPNKPEIYGFMRAQVILYPDYWDSGHATTYPIGILAELYLNFGFPGIFGGMFFVGALLSRINALSKRSASAHATILCALVATFLTPQRTFGTVLLAILLYMAYYAIVTRLRVTM